MATGPERGQPGIGDDNKADSALERELARKEKALAEAATLLVLKKVQALEEDEDVDTDEEHGL